MPVLFGAKWGLSQANGTSGGVVTWSLAGAGLAGVQNTYGTFLSDLTVSAGALRASYNVEAELRGAFAAWSAVSDISFVQLADDTSEVGIGIGADIRIFFGQIDGSSGGTLALAFFPFSQFDPRAGDVLFDVAETAFYSTRTNFRAVAIHEIGHSIGLDHISGVRAIMNPFVGAVSELQPDDIEGATTIYGPATGAAAEMTVGISPDLAILHGPPGLRLLGDGRANAITGGAGREELLGFAGSDRLHGGGDADTLLGGGGADTLFGGGGRDRVEGGGGRDRIEGGGGADLLIGGGGADRLVGGKGADTMTGGGGPDSFVFQRSSGADRVTDFRPGVDLLDYSGHSGVSRLADLSLSDAAGGALVRDGFGNSVLLAGVAASALGEDDFLF